MKRIRKEIVGIAMLALAGLAIFFASCEKEALGGAGELVEVRFALVGVEYGGSGELGMRGAKGTLGSGGAREGELAEETVIVPLDEEYCFYATLKEEDRSETALDGSQLRASTLTSGTLLRIVAFQGGVDQGAALYKVAADGTHLVPEGSAAGLILPAGSYDFVAYSYNSTSVVPDYSSPVGDVTVSPEYDLLWGEEPDVTVSEGIDVGISLYHKFSQVAVSVTAAAITPAVVISAITNFSVSPGYKATLTVADGTMAKEGTAVTQGLTPTWNNLNTATVTSATGRIVYTAGEQPVSVTIGSVTVGTVTYPNVVAKFNMSLELGKSYTLSVDFKRNLVWAGSNVYWTAAGGGKLTFDAPGAALNNQRKQGVFFKWGSLVGISPAGAEGDVFGSTTPVYIPVFTSSSSKSWSTTNSYSTWGDIAGESVSGSGALNASRFSTWLMDDARNTDNDYAYWKARKGDICRYISENGYGPTSDKYRMPTAYEFGAKTSYSYGSDGWTKNATSFSADFSATGADGTRVMAYYATNNYGTGSVTFPASGWRTPKNPVSSLSEVGIYGMHFSGSFVFNLMLCIDRSSVYMEHTMGTSTGAVAVRCVRNN